MSTQNFLGTPFFDCYEFRYVYEGREVRRPIENFKGGAEECRARCSAVSDCRFFTWRQLSLHRAQCLLKSEKGRKKYDKKAVSGTATKNCRGKLICAYCSNKITDMYSDI